MAISIRNSDLILKFTDDEVSTILNKYDAYLEALYNDDYAFHRDAVRKAVGYLRSEKFATMEDLAKKNYERNPKIKERFTSKEEFISHIPLAKQKSCSMDLATGTGKSFLMFGIAQLMLCEEAIEKVLILCPSLTIEEGLTQKFKELNNRKDLTDILRSINPKYVQPEIKNASETILANDICIENIHVTYQRTGSSVEASFKNEGEKVLVMNDEAHHIFTGEADAPTKKWIEFLMDKEYDFRYIVNVTGTPYYGSDQNEYFNDVIYRFGLKDAVEKGIVKRVDYKTFDEYKEDKGYQQSWAIHKENIKTYGKYVKPISIVICATIADAIVQWQELVNFLADKEKISYDEACEKVIWVTSGVPGSNTIDGQRIAPILKKDKEERGTDTIRKDNLKLLKTVDLPKKENPIEWIVSVSMLAEGWDVKNVFQVIPHKQRAFNSKLLIAQVLGRGLRMPQTLKDAIGADKVFLKVNNHEKWTPQIQDLYNDVLEIDNRLSWGYDRRRKQYAFTLHNLHYEPLETTTESKEKQAEFNGNFGFNPQKKISEYKTDFAHNTISYVFEDMETYSLDLAATNLHSYLKDKSAEIAKQYPKRKLKTLFRQELESKSYENDFLSKDNYIKAQQAFGPLFREVGKQVPRVSNRPDALFEIDCSEFPTQSFSEESLKRIGALYFTDDSLDWYQNEERNLFAAYLETDKKIEQSEQLRKTISDPSILSALDANLSILQELKSRLHKITAEKFKTALCSVFVSYAPEIAFMRTLILNIAYFDAFLKSSNNNFYSFPYSYKPEVKGKSHPRQENFNPDFFIKIKNTDDILVIETKKEGDDNPKNKAKFRDGKEHFRVLNGKLIGNDIKARYFFKFLSDDGSDIADFFGSIKDGKYKTWSSKLMNQLK